MMSGKDEALRVVERGQQKLKDGIAESTRLIGEVQQRLDQSRLLTGEAPPEKISLPPQS
jgi:hypothetical protein